MSTKSVLGSPTRALPTALLLSAGLWLANSLQAAKLTWTGAVSSDWQTAGNWSPAQVPTASDTVNISSTVTTATASLFGTLHFDVRISAWHWPRAASVGRGKDGLDALDCPARLIL